MKRRFEIVAGIVLILSLVLGGVALAQSPTPPNPPERPQGLLGWLRDPENRWKVFDAIAETLKLSPTQLFEQLHAGNTLKDVAGAQGVEMRAVKDAAVKARIEVQREAVQQALQEGRITQAQADKLLERLDAGKPLRPLLWLRMARGWPR
jgi:hypothetical protein